MYTSVRLGRAYDHCKGEDNPEGALYTEPGVVFVINPAPVNHFRYAGL